MIEDIMKIRTLSFLALSGFVLGNNLLAAASSVAVPVSSAFASQSFSLVGCHDCTTPFMSRSSPLTSPAVCLPINQVDQHKLRNLAEVQGLGDKSANLMVLRDGGFIKIINYMLSNHPKFSGFIVRIPEFV